jgi:hypothetical protein
MPPQADRQVAEREYSFIRPFSQVNAISSIRGDGSIPNQFSNCHLKNQSLFFSAGLSL